MHHIWEEQKSPKLGNNMTVFDLPIHQGVLNDAYESATRYDELVTRAARIIMTLEATLSSFRVDLHNPRVSLEQARLQQEELQSVVADLEGLTEALGAISSPEAKEQLHCTSQALAAKNSAVKAGLQAQEAEEER